MFVLRKVKVLVECQSALMATGIGASMYLNSRWGPSVQSGAVVWFKWRILVYTSGCVWCNSWGAYPFDGNITTGKSHGQIVVIGASESSCEAENCVSWHCFDTLVCTNHFLLISLQESIAICVNCMLKVLLCLVPFMLRFYTLLFESLIS